MAAAFRGNRVGTRVQNENRHFRTSPCVRRFGLLTPWGGGNLGNSAIISAVISNLSKRNSPVEFVGITLNPEQTHRRYGIEAFPLAATSRPLYSQQGSGGANGGGSQIHKKVPIKQLLKRIPLVGAFLRQLRAWGQEIAHIKAAACTIRRLDVVMIPGGGPMDEFWGGTWGQPWSLLKWSLLSRVYRVPFLFVSVGKGSLERPASRFFVSVALKLATYRSYRDPDAKIAAQQLIGGSSDPLLPDLAFSYPAPAIHKRPVVDPRNQQLTIGVSPIAYCDPRVWPVSDERRYATYVRRLAEMVKWLLSQGHRLFFFATDSPDLETIKDLLAQIDDLPRGSDAILTLPGPVEQSIDGHLEGIGQADLIVASRLHGVILSHLVAVPALAISYDPKVDAQMRIAKAEAYCLDIDDLALNQFIERFEALNAARVRESAHLRSLARLFRQQLDPQYDQILSFGCRQVSGVRAESRRPALVR
jgi:polysaccharide pyruvyl transferase WcaK-like protein